MSRASEANGFPALRQEGAEPGKPGRFLDPHPESQVGRQSGVGAELADPAHQPLKSREALLELRVAPSRPVREGGAGQQIRARPSVIPQALPVHGQPGAGRRGVP